MLVAGIGVSAMLHAQTQADVKKQLDAANAALVKKDLKNVDKCLTDAMAALAKLAGYEIMKFLPVELNGLKSKPAEDMVQMGLTTMAPGNQMLRSYSSEDGLKRIVVKILPYDIELASVNMLLEQPVYMKSDEVYQEKLVMVKGRKALLKTDKTAKTAELSVVSGSTIYKIETSGEVYTESILVDLATKIDIGKIETILR